jgi:hypothetical protein
MRESKMPLTWYDLGFGQLKVILACPDDQVSIQRKSKAKTISYIHSHTILRHRYQHQQKIYRILYQHKHQIVLFSTALSPIALHAQATH